MSAPRGHRAETGMLADAFDVHVRPDRKDSPGQPCAGARATGESLVGSDGRAA